MTHNIRADTRFESNGFELRTRNNSKCVHRIDRSADLTGMVVTYCGINLARKRVTDAPNRVMVGRRCQLCYRGLT